MDKRIIHWLFTACVFLLSLSLAVGMLFAGPSPAGANERLAEAPSLTDRQGNINWDILSDTFDWFSDRFFGRQQLISLNNWLCANLLGTSDADDVLLGTEGWLYYAPTLDAYTGADPMPQRELYSAARNLWLMQEYLQGQGREFCFLVAPNKNSLYPQYMPGYGMTAERKDYQQLFSLLDAMGVSYIDLYSLFGAEEEVLYFAHDSHWNSRGAALGADAINAAFGKESDYYGDAFLQTRTHQGDLYEMLYPAFTDTEQDPVYGGSLDFGYEGNATQPDSITLLTASDSQGSLLCYRDSFGNLLYPYLADSFGACRFSRAVSYDLTQEGESVLIELVERNLRYLVQNLPVMPAPERQLELPEASGTTAMTVSQAKKLQGTVLVEGVLPETADADTNVYIVCGNGAYEAFLLENGGYAAYVPEGETILGAAFHAEGQLRLLTVQ